MNCLFHVNMTAQIVSNHSCVCASKLVRGNCDSHSIFHNALYDLLTKVERGFRGRRKCPRIKAHFLRVWVYDKSEW